MGGASGFVLEGFGESGSKLIGLAGGLSNCTSSPWSDVSPGVTEGVSETLDRVEADEVKGRGAESLEAIWEVSMTGVILRFPSFVRVSVCSVIVGTLAESNLGS